MSDGAAPAGLAHWRAAWAGLGAAVPEAVHAEVMAAYAEPHRAYHTRQHLDECLDLLRQARPLCRRPDEVALALWFHDAVYQPQRHDNEARSAEWLRRVAGNAGVAAEVISRLHDLIMATRHAAAPVEPDEQVLVDIDLAILGAPAARFEEYDRQVREEYAWVEESRYRQVRAGVLAEFLARPRLYSTPWFHERLEQRARANLADAIARLAPPP